MYLLCFLLVAYVVDSATYPLYSLTTADKTNLVKYHNFVRANWGMPALKNTNAISGWSDTLATNAGKHAQNCIWQHSSAKDRTYGQDEFGNDLTWGENMAKIGTQDFAAKFPFGTLASQVDGWKNEEKDWDCTKTEFYVFADGSSEDGCRKTPNADGSLPMCGHFTQVVWKTTTEIGCALVDCPKDTAWAGYRSQFLVCQYNPGGNTAGAHPLKGYGDLADDYSKYTSSYANCPGGKPNYQTAAVQPLTAEDSGVATQNSHTAADPVPVPLTEEDSGVATQNSHTAADGITVPVGAFVAVAVVCALVVFLVILVVIAFIVVIKKGSTKDSNYNLL